MTIVYLAVSDFEGQILDLELDAALTLTKKAPPRAPDMSKGLPQGHPINGETGDPNMSLDWG